jgi:hypothetical protein
MFEVITTGKIHVEVFWVVTPCSVVVVYQIIFIPKKEAARSSETRQSQPITPRQK